MKEKELNPVAARRGLIVTVAGKPGKWQLLEKSPNGPGKWWLLAYDDEARAYANRPSLPPGSYAGYDEAKTIDMRNPKD